jgi:hypothetical protein
MARLVYLAFCVSVVAALAAVQWYGWAPQQCWDHVDAASDWQEPTDDGACTDPQKRSIRSRSYQGGK